MPGLPAAVACSLCTLGPVFARPGYHCFHLYVTQSLFCLLPGDSRSLVRALNLYQAALRRELFHVQGPAPAPVNAPGMTPAPGLALELRLALGAEADFVWECLTGPPVGNLFETVDYWRAGCLRISMPYSERKFALQ